MPPTLPFRISNFEFRINRPTSPDAWRTRPQGGLGGTCIRVGGGAGASSIGRAKVWRIIPLVDKSMRMET